MVRLPGIVDRHVHLGLVDGEAMRGGAVVEVHDLGWIPAEADRFRTERTGGCVVRVAGAFHTPPGGYPLGRSWAPDAAVREVVDLADATAALEEHAGELLKVVLHADTPWPDPLVLRSLVVGAHRAGRMVVAHVEGPGQAEAALAARVDAFAHVPWTERLPDEVVQGCAARMEWISTLSLHEEEARRIALDNARRFVAAGGRLRYGTDAGNGPWAPGVRRAEVLALGEAGLAGDALIEALTGWSGGPVAAAAEVEADAPMPNDPADVADWYAGARRVVGAAALDAGDPLGDFVDRFLRPPEVVAYLDGNSLGRPLASAPEDLAAFARDRWGARLIRGWDEGWMEAPQRIGDRLGRAVVGAAEGQVVVGDSTTVLLYKAVRAAVAARPGRRELVHAAADFPTDRFVLQGVAAELGLRLVPIEAPHDGGVAPEQVTAVVGPDTAVVLLSHVAYRSAAITDAAAVTAIAHDAGALVVWDLSHSAGAVPVELDRWSADLAVGCSYKYLNGGPGAPAFVYARRDLLPALQQPIQGWMGAAEPFAMGERYGADPGVRRFLSGTPSIVAMQPLTAMLDVIEEAGVAAIRRKSEALTAFTVAWADEHLLPLGVRLASPRDPARRGSHVTLDHAAFPAMLPRLHARGVIPDFRRPDGLRIGLSPLSTSFAEVEQGLEAVADELRRDLA